MIIRQKTTGAGWASVWERIYLSEDVTWKARDIWHSNSNSPRFYVLQGLNTAEPSPQVRSQRLFWGVTLTKKKMQGKGMKGRARLYHGRNPPEISYISKVQILHFILRRYPAIRSLLWKLVRQRYLHRSLLRVCPGAPEIEGSTTFRGYGTLVEHREWTD